jgi:Ca2+-binding EF-hand superfamily protein
MTRKTIALVATSFLVCTVSTAALAVSKSTAVTADRDVRTLVRMMDKDMNGVVSKDEFMQFMSRTFDRLDVNKSGTLEHRELHSLVAPGGLLGDCVHTPFPQCSGGE